MSIRPKRILIAAMILMTGLSNIDLLNAQSAVTFLNLMPDDRMPLLRPETRKMMIEQYQKGEAQPTVNIMGGKTYIDTLAADYIKLHPTAASCFEMKVLPTTTGDSVILAVIYTVSAPAADSEVSFFTTSWQELPAQAFFTAPDITDFCIEADRCKTETGNMKQWLTPCIVGYEFAPTGRSIIATTHPEKYLPQEYYAKIADCLKQTELLYRWDGQNFKQDNTHTK